MTRMAHRLPRWQLGTLVAVGVVALTTGCAWLGLHYTVGAGAGNLPHGGEARLMRLHGLSVFGALFMFGVLAGAHIPRGWHLTARRSWAGQRPSGVGLCTLACLVALTGYLLYYAAPEAVRPLLGWIHSGAGVMMAVLVIRHRRRVRPRAEN